MASAAAGLGISPASAGIRVTVSPMPGSRSCQGTPPPAGRRPGRRVTAPHGSGHGGLDPLDPARPRLARGAVVDGDPGLGALFLHGLEGLACRVGRVQFRCFLARPGVAGRHGFAREPGKGCGKALQPLHPDDGEQGLAAGIHKFQPGIDLATRHRAGVEQHAGSIHASGHAPPRCRPPSASVSAGPMRSCVTPSPRPMTISRR